MKFNKQMMACLQDIDQNIKLNPTLLQIVDGGFVKWHGCYLLKYFSTSATDELKKLLVDEVSIEAFINHTHMSDYVKDNFMSHAACYVHKIFDQWRKYFKEKLVCYIEAELFKNIDDNQSNINCSPSNVTVRFHAKREGIKYCDDSLDNFLVSAVMRIESDENIFEKLALM